MWVQGARVSVSECVSVNVTVVIVVNVRVSECTYVCKILMFERGETW